MITQPHTTQTSTTAAVAAPPPLQRKILDTMAKKTFCTLATTSPAGRPHSAGVVYEWAAGTKWAGAMWVHVSRHSRKARSIAANPHVGVCIPYRRLPVGPPFTIHFQARAEIVAMDDPAATELLDAGRLKKISGHGALDMADGCFLVIRPHGMVHSFGPGAKTLDLIRDPLTSGARSFRLDETSDR